MNILIVGSESVNRLTGQLVKAVVVKAWYPGFTVLLDDRPGVSAVCAFFAERIGANYRAYGTGLRAANGASCYTCLPGTVTQRDNWLISRVDVVVSIGITAMYYRALRAEKEVILKQVQEAR